MSSNEKTLAEESINKLKLSHHIVSCFSKSVSYTTVKIRMRMAEFRIIDENFVGLSKMSDEEEEKKELHHWSASIKYKKIEVTFEEKPAENVHRLRRGSFYLEEFTDKSEGTTNTAHAPHFVAHIPLTIWKRERLREEWWKQAEK